MSDTAVYMDNHATTRVDPRVVQAMLPFFSGDYGNAASTTHALGAAARQAVDSARASIAAAIGATPRELVFTSGATESNNLAIRGAAEHPRRRGSHLISVVTEHPSVLDPLRRLSQQGFEVTLLPVVESPDPRAGLVLAEQVGAAIRPETFLVSVMLANNEIGAIAPLGEIGRICRQRGVLLHSDATQAVGKIPVDVEHLALDLLSFSGHKLYGPKGIGALYVRRRPKAVRLEPLLLGGGHEGGLRSGTANVPAIVGFAAALELCLAEMTEETVRLQNLRNLLWEGLVETIPGVELNGPSLTMPELRLPGNLNARFAGLDGESLLIAAEGIALSAGSACTSATPEPSHVLQALGIGADATRSSLRFGLGRFNTPEDVQIVIRRLQSAAAHLRRLGS